MKAVMLNRNSWMRLPIKEIPMEQVIIHLKNQERYDELIELSRTTHTPECGDMEIITKDDCTESGTPGVMVAFTVMVDGKPRRVQAVITARLFIDAGVAVRAAHGL